MATSGTVGQTTFTTQQVIDHAFRRCKLVPQQITSEMLSTAQELLWLLLSKLNQRGIALWAVQTQLLGLIEGNSQVALDVGTLDVLDSNLRSMTRLTGTATSSAGTAANAFDGDLATSCTLVAVSGSITLQLSTASALNMVGVCPNVSGTWGYTIQTSGDGSTWNTVITRSSAAVTAGQWIWHEVQGAPSVSYMRIVADSSTILNVRELVFANTPSDIPITKIDRNTYWALPNKAFTGRPTQFWYDRQRSQAVMNLWPAPNSSYTITSCLALKIQRQIMDVGTLAQELEVPQRWYLAVVLMLAAHCSKEFKEVDPSVKAEVIADAAKEEADAWDGEGDSAPVRIIPNIRGYTR